MKQAQPITESGYWNALWQAGRTLRPIDPHKGGLRNYAYRHLHREFAAALANTAPQGKQLIEAGCGGSRWLAYFHSTFGCAVSGIDYSPEGCAATQALLNTLAIEGNIILGDLFDPPTDLSQKFDFVVSIGLVEHFADTVAAVTACASLLKPGGTMITLVPNMTGPLGWLQRFFDRALYEKHLPLSCEQLAQAHIQNDLIILSSRYALLAHLGALQFGSLERLMGNRLAQVIKIALSAPIWALGPRLGLRPNRITSPYVMCVARKRGANVKRLGANT